MTDSAPPSDLGPVVDLDDSPEWTTYYEGEGESSGVTAERDQTEWNDPEGAWVLDIGRGAATAEAAREAVHKEWDEFCRRMVASRFTEESLLDGIEKVFSTSKAAEFFGRSTQWMYWGLRPDAKTGEHPFSYKDGTPILPERVGAMGKRRFTLPIIKEIAQACYRRGSFTYEELETVMEKILLAEFGRRAFADD